MRLIDERLVPGRQRRTIVAPGERGVHYGRQRSEPCAVAFVERQVGVGMVELVGEQRIIPLQVTPDRLRIRVEQEFLGVEPVSFEWLERAMHSVTVELAGNDVRRVVVPDLCCLLEERDGRRFLRVAGLIEKAELDLRRILREKTEIDTSSVPSGSQGIWSSRPDTHDFLRRMRYFAAGGDAKLCHPLLTLIVRSAVIYYAVAMPIPTSPWLAHAA